MMGRKREGEMTPSMFLIDLNVIGDRAQFLPLISTSWVEVSMSVLVVVW